MQPARAIVLSIAIGALVATPIAAADTATSTAAEPSDEVVIFAC